MRVSRILNRDDEAEQRRAEELVRQWEEQRRTAQQTPLPQEWDPEEEDLEDEEA